MENTKSVTTKANVWVKKYLSDFSGPEHDELIALVIAIQNDAVAPYRAAINTIGANIEGKLTALEMQAIALEAINETRISNDD